MLKLRHNFLPKKQKTWLRRVTGHNLLTRHLQVIYFLLLVKISKNIWWCPVFLGEFLKLIIIFCYCFFCTDMLTIWFIIPWDTAELFALLGMFRFRKLQLCWARCQYDLNTPSIFPSNWCLMKTAFCTTWFQQILKEQRFQFIFKWVSKALVVVADVLPSFHCLKSKKTYFFSHSTFSCF